MVLISSFINSFDIADQCCSDKDFLMELFAPKEIQVKLDSWHGMNRIIRAYNANKTLTFKKSLAFKADLKMLVRSSKDARKDRNLPTASPEVITQRLQNLESNYNLHPNVSKEIANLKSHALQGCLRY